MLGVKGIFLGVVKCRDKKKKTESEGILLGQYWHWDTKVKVANGIRYPSSLNCKRWILGIRY